MLNPLNAETMKETIAFLYQLLTLLGVLPISVKKKENEKREKKHLFIEHFDLKSWKECL